MRQPQAINVLPQAPEAAAAAGAPAQELRPGQPLRLNAARGWLTVVSGSVWLTRLDDFEDHWLSAGQSMHLMHARSVVVEAWDHRAARIVWHAEQGTSVPAAAAARAAPSAAATSWAAGIRRALHAVLRGIGLAGPAADDNRPGQQQGRAHGGHGRSGGAGRGAWA